MKSWQFWVIVALLLDVHVDVHVHPYVWAKVLCILFSTLAWVWAIVQAWRDK